MKDWKILLIVVFVAAILGKVLLPGGGHASPPQAISVANGPPSGPCVSPLIYIDSASARMYMCSNEAWVALMPSGTMIMSLTPCGSGWTEVSSMSGVFPMGTVSTNSDVATTGGASSQTFTTAINVSLLGLGIALTGPSPISTIPPYKKVIFCQLP